jgi:cell division protease FtsH
MEGRGDELSDVLAAHLGADAWSLPAASGSWPPYEHVNVQTGVEQWLARNASEQRLIGLVGFRHRMFGLVDLCQPGGEQGLGVGGVATVEMAAGPDGLTHACVQCGLYLVHIGEARAALLLRGSDQRGPQPDVTVEIVASDPDTARTAVAEIRRLAIEHSVYRGHVVSFEASPLNMRGENLLVFQRRVPLARVDLVLPEGVLEGVEQHIHGVARHHDLLLAHGLHLKRGVLLYGAPGTGKTHTVRYLTGLLPETTVVVLSGSALRFIGEACALARDLQPAMLVIEDVDLIAEDRNRMVGSAPLLFQLLNEMDGLGEDADVAFVLTTNRPDVLEPALASRPGRIDHAVELPLPDTEGRRRLIDIYRGTLDLELADPDAVIERTEGVTASFIKELLRKAALIAADEDSEQLRVTDEHLRAALDVLLDERNTLTRRLLGSGASDKA